MPPINPVDSFSWTDVLKRGLNFASTGLAKDVLGHLGQPIFYNIKDQRKKELEGTETQEQNTGNIFTKIFRTLKEGTSYGDAYTGVGIAALLLNHFFGNPESGSHKWINRLGWGITIGGFGLARMARKLGLHFMYALGDDAGGALLDKIQKELNLNIFEKLDNNKLKDAKKNLEKVLTYKNSITSKMRTIVRDGGFIYGVPGTGKTSGVNCFLGEWIAGTEQQNLAPEVHMLRLAEFTEGLDKVKAKEKKIIQDLSKLEGRLGVVANLIENEALTALKLLVGKCETVKASVAQKNNESEKQSCATVFIDDIDKACNLAGLGGADQQTVVSLFGRLNNLLEDPQKSATGQKLFRVIMTSNLDPTQIRKKLEGVLPKETLDAFMSRLTTNMVEVELPDVPEQARMAANYLIRDHSEHIDYFSLGLSSPTNNQIHLAEAILKNPEVKLETLGPVRINGRHLEQAIKRLKDELVVLGRQKLLRDRSPDNVSEMSEEEVIKQSGIKIDSNMLFNVLKDQYENNYLKSLDPNDVNPTNIQAESIFTQFIRTNKEDISKFSRSKEGTSLTPLDLLEALYVKKEDSCAIIYTPKNDQKVVLSNNGYCHKIIIDKSTPEHTVHIKYDFLNRNDSLWLGRAYRLNEFQDILSRELAFAIEDKDVLGKFIKLIFEGLSNSGALEQALKGLT